MIKKAIDLKNVEDYSLNNRDKFSVEYLRKDLEKIWLSKV
jgi:hypothetical protein